MPPNPTIPSLQLILRRSRRSGRRWACWVLRLTRLRHEPRIIGHWLVEARAAQVTLLLGLIAIAWIVPPLREALAGAVVPKEGLFDSIGGIFGGESRSDRLRLVVTRGVDLVAWIGLLGAVTHLLLRRVPRYRASRAVIAEEQEHAGPHPIPTPSRLVANRYELLAEIGRGGGGIVHRAHDRVLRRELALKELTQASLNREASTERFREEARALARLNHPGIVQIHDMVHDRGRLWLVMELVRGGDLERLLRAEGSLGVDHACTIGAALADALACAHEQGVIHRDLKPLNVLMVDPNTPKITDFGLAKLGEGSSHTIQGMAVGSPHYMSPEQCAGEPTDARSDIYSLGVILYEMLGGTPPFRGDTRTILAQHLHRRPIPLRELVPTAGIPGELEGTVDRMLAKKPAERPQSMRLVRDALSGSEYPVLP